MHPSLHTWGMAGHRDGDRDRDRKRDHVDIGHVLHLTDGYVRVHMCTYVCSCGWQKLMSSSLSHSLSKLRLWTWSSVRYPGPSSSGIYLSLNHWVQHFNVGSGNQNPSPHACEYLLAEPSPQLQCPSLIKIAWHIGWFRQSSNIPGSTWYWGTLASIPAKPCIDIEVPWNSLTMSKGSSWPSSHASHAHESHMTCSTSSCCCSHITTACLTGNCTTYAFFPWHGTGSSCRKRGRFTPAFRIVTQNHVRSRSASKAGPLSKSAAHLLIPSRNTMSFGFPSGEQPGNGPASLPDWRGSFWRWTTFLVCSPW